MKYQKGKVKNKISFKIASQKKTKVQGKTNKFTFTSGKFKHTSLNS